MVALQVEYLLEHDGPAEMTSEDFPTSHSILFWNMVWWFCREQLSSALPLYVLYNFRNLHPNNKVLYIVSSECSRYFILSAASVTTRYFILSAVSVQGTLYCQQ